MAIVTAAGCNDSVATRAISAELDGGAGPAPAASAHPPADLGHRFRTLAQPGKSVFVPGAAHCFELRFSTLGDDVLFWDGGPNDRSKKRLGLRYEDPKRKFARTFGVEIASGKELVAFLLRGPFDEVEGQSFVGGRRLVFRVIDLTADRLVISPIRQSGPDSGAGEGSEARGEWFLDGKACEANRGSVRHSEFGLLRG